MNKPSPARLAEDAQIDATLATCKSFDTADECLARAEQHFSVALRLVRHARAEWRAGRNHAAQASGIPHIAGGLPPAA